MSRIGKQPISVPSGVEITIEPELVKVKGPKGELSLNVHPAMTVAYDSAAREINVTRPDDARQNRALHGLTRALIANMVEGVAKPFEKKLEIQGVGYQATLAGKNLSLQVGFANTIKLPVPAGITFTVPQPTQIIITGIDGGKQAFEYIKAGTSLKITMGQSLYEVSWLNVFYAHQFLAGNPVPRIVISPVYPVTHDHLKDIDIPDDFDKPGRAQELGWVRAL